MVEAFAWIGQDLLMPLDHVSCITSHDPLTEIAQGLGSRLETTFVERGTYSRFERRFGRPAVDGNQTEPDGTELILRKIALSALKSKPQVAH